MGERQWVSWLRGLGGSLALSEPVSSAGEMGVKISATQESGHGQPSAIRPHYPLNWLSLGAQGLLTRWLPVLVSPTSSWHDAAVPGSLRKTPFSPCFIPSWGPLSPSILAPASHLRHPAQSLFSSCSVPCLEKAAGQGPTGGQSPGPTVLSSPRYYQ